MRNLRYLVGFSVICGVAYLALTRTGVLPQRSISSEEPDPNAVGIRIGKLFARVTPSEKGKARRPVFSKAHGCLKATFEVHPDLPQELRVGVFAGKEYPAWIRFSNDGPPRPDNEPTARGMSIKLLKVPGAKLLSGEEDAQTQDFLMENYPVFFVDTAQDFLDFTESIFDPSLKGTFEKAHPETQQIQAEMDKQILIDPLDGQYWTPTPYRLGKQAMKYRVTPCKGAERLAQPVTEGDHFLRENLAQHAMNLNSCLEFQIQLQKDPATYPIDRATVLWSETESPFITAATLKIASKQDVKSPDRQKYCENLSFTGWHALPEHEPLGSINLARRHVYKLIADLRRGKNSVPLLEPSDLTEVQ